MERSTQLSMQPTDRKLQLVYLSVIVVNCGKCFTDTSLFHSQRI
jgi:hypothetical protein